MRLFGRDITFGPFAVTIRLKPSLEGFAEIDEQAKFAAGVPRRLWHLNTKHLAPRRHVKMLRPLIADQNRHCELAKQSPQLQAPDRIEIASQARNDATG